MTQLFDTAGYDTETRPPVGASTGASMTKRSKLAAAASPKHARHSVNLGPQPQLPSDAPP